MAPLKATLFKVAQNKIAPLNDAPSESQNQIALPRIQMAEQQTLRARSTSVMSVTNMTSTPSLTSTEAISSEASFSKPLDPANMRFTGMLKKRGKKGLIMQLIVVNSKRRLRELDVFKLDTKGLPAKIEQLRRGHDVMIRKMARRDRRRYGEPLQETSQETEEQKEKEEVSVASAEGSGSESAEDEDSSDENEDDSNSDEEELAPIKQIWKFKELILDTKIKMKLLKEQENNPKLSYKWEKRILEVKEKEYQKSKKGMLPEEKEKKKEELKLWKACMKDKLKRAEEKLEVEKANLEAELKMHTKNLKIAKKLREKELKVLRKQEKQEAKEEKRMMKQIKEEEEKMAKMMAKQQRMQKKERSE